MPSYTWAYGGLNFLVLCNTGVLLTAMGLILESPLLISSQAVAAPIVCGVWGLDVLVRATTGEFLFGGTAYMWDLQYPIFTRMLSLYHLAWPLVLFFALRRMGYDRRGFALQCLLATTLISGGRWLDPALNFNFAYKDPILGLGLEPAALHLLLVVGVSILGMYLPAHWLLRRFPEPSAFENEATESLGAPQLS